MNDPFLTAHNGDFCYFISSSNVAVFKEFNKSKEEQKKQQASRDASFKAPGTKSGPRALNGLNWDHVDTDKEGFNENTSGIIKLFAVCFKFWNERVISKGFSENVFWGPADVLCPGWIYHD